MNISCIYVYIYNYIYVTGLCLGISHLDLQHPTKHLRDLCLKKTWGQVDFFVGLFLNHQLGLKNPCERCPPRRSDGPRLQLKRLFWESRDAGGLYSYIFLPIGWAVSKVATGTAYACLICSDLSQHTRCLFFLLVLVEIRMGFDYPPGKEPISHQTGPKEIINSKVMFDGICLVPRRVCYYAIRSCFNPQTFPNLRTSPSMNEMIQWS